MKEFDFRLQNDVIGKLDEFTDLFILFSEDGLLTVDIPLFVLFFIMITNIVNLNVVLQLEFFNFFVDGDL